MTIFVSCGITDVRNLDFFFEPDPETELFKLCPCGTGSTNTREGMLRDIPDFIPQEEYAKAALAAKRSVSMDG